MARSIVTVGSQVIVQSVTSVRSSSNVGSQTSIIDVDPVIQYYVLLESGNFLLQEDGIGSILLE